MYTDGKAEEMLDVITSIECFKQCYKAWRQTEGIFGALKIKI